MTSKGQSALSVLKNKSYFEKHHKTYAARIGRFKTYRNIRAALTECLVGAGDLLDVGNGGVFAYDVDLARRIVAIDLVVADDGCWPDHVSVRRGDALDLPVDDQTFDTVVACMLIHHLTGESVAQSRENVTRFFQECRRVVRRGGRVVICESCVPSWFFRFECRVFGPLCRAAARWMTHPMTLQYTAQEIRHAMTDVFRSEPAVRRVPKGPVVLQFGVPFPAAFTPVVPYVFTCHVP